MTPAPNRRWYVLVAVLAFIAGWLVAITQSAKEAARNTTRIGELQHQLRAMELRNPPPTDAP
jgi:hypothetical protein